MNKESDEFTRESITESSSMVERTYSKEGTTVADSINKSLDMVYKANERLITEHQISADMYVDIALTYYHLIDLENQIKELKNNKYKMTPNIHMDLENIHIKIRKILNHLCNKVKY